MNYHYRTFDSITTGDINVLWSNRKFYLILNAHFCLNIAHCKITEFVSLLGCDLPGGCMGVGWPGGMIHCPKGTGSCGAFRRWNRFPTNAACRSTSSLNLFLKKSNFARGILARALFNGKPLLTPAFSLHVTPPIYTPKARQTMGQPVAIWDARIWEHV